MTGIRSNEYIDGLVRELCKLPHETEWVEFKGNNQDPHLIGEYISALSNAAALNGKAFAYMVWGVEDGSHVFTGTSFSSSLPSSSSGRSVICSRMPILCVQIHQISSAIVQYRALFHFLS